MLLETSFQGEKGRRTSVCETCITIKTGVLEFSWETGPIRTFKIRSIKRFIEELAPVIMKTEKSHHLLSANWRSRKTSVGRPENQASGWYKFQSEGSRLSQLSQTGWEGMDPPFLCFLLHSSHQQIGWCSPPRGGHSEATDSNINLRQQHPHSHGQQSCLIWAPQVPATLTYAINNHSSKITLSSKPFFFSYAVCVPYCTVQIKPKYSF